MTTLEIARPPLPSVQPQGLGTSSSVERYLARLTAAAAHVESGATAAEQALADGRTGGLRDLDPRRLTTAVQQADDALAELAAAERYRRRSHVGVPGPVYQRAVQAINDLEMGTRALRRATVLLADPDVDIDPQRRQATLSAMGIGASHYRMADWLLDTAAAPTPSEPDRS